MGLLIGFAFLAGIITVLSPCVLPVLPVILSGTVANGRLRPLGIIGGFLVSFSLLTLGLTFLVRNFGIDPDLLRVVAAVTIIVFALVLVIPALKDRFMALATKLLVRRQQMGTIGQVKKNAKPTTGFWTGFLTGTSLGIVWTPCVGPIMASVITLAISQSIDSSAVLITLAYALGTAVPLFAVMQGGRALFTRFPKLNGRLPAVQRVFGVLMLVTGIALLTGLDRSFSSWLLKAFPNYGSGLTAIEDNTAVQSALDKRANAETDKPEIPDRAGSDPLSRTSGQWFNSPMLTLEGLKGKVVLVDFWTYSCINCLRTLPYLKAWQDRYATSGLVIVGVHSPEFAFEQDSANLKKAIADLGVSWPVVQDNAFGIWNAFSNRYWPAHYLFDKNGKLVDTHFGEGAYAETEAMIQTLLGQIPNKLSADSIQANTGGAAINPETYLGSARGEKLPAMDPKNPNIYQFGGSLPQFGWDLAGSWQRSGEYIESFENAQLRLDFQAKAIYLVISAVPGSQAALTILQDGKAVTTPDVHNGQLTVTGDRLYQVLGNPRSAKGTLTIRVQGKARLHAFTFS